LPDLNRTADMKSQHHRRFAFAYFLTIIFIVTMMLAAMFILWRAAAFGASLESPLQRGVAVGAESLLGAGLFLGMVWWLPPHLAVLLAELVFGKQNAPSPGGKLG
jgi:hypothetical protein